MTTMVSVFPPQELASKVLSVTDYGDGKRKIQISSNLLPLFSFEKGAKVIEKSLGQGLGYVVELANQLPAVFSKAKRVYSREYKKRRNSPFETVFETSAKYILDQSIPMHVKKVHVTFTHGKLTVRPLIDMVAYRLAKVLQADDPLTIFAGCTSGIDVHAAHSAGFTINSILEWRPNEARDKTDLTETGALSAIGNVPVKHLFNEDITTVDTQFLKAATKKAKSTLFTLSIQCDDVSQVKGGSLKDKSFDDGSSTLDMAFDGLRIIEKLQFPMVLMEQVSSFANMQLAKLWDLRLRKWGYHTYSMCLDARDFGSANAKQSFAVPLRATSKNYNSLSAGEQRFASNPLPINHPANRYRQSKIKMGDNTKPTKPRHQFIHFSHLFYTERSGIGHLSLKSTNAFLL